MSRGDWLAARPVGNGSTSAFGDAPTIALAGIGAALVVLVAVGLVILTWRGLPLAPIPRSQVFAATQCLAGLLWLGAVVLVHRHRFAPRTMWVVLVVAAAMRVMTFAAPPLLSSDIYRYVWDGRVQRAGINPYRYLPDAPQLAFLRDAAVFPNINRADYAPTIYPPAAEALFALAGHLAPGIYGMKAVMAAFDILAIAALLRLLCLAGRDRTQVLIYAWLPLPVWEFAGNGHIDAAASGLLSLALLCAAYGGAARTGVVLAAATLTKFLPGVMLPAFWRPWNWRLAGAFVLATAAFYAPYIGVGRHVFGFLGGYAKEENLVQGGGIFVLAAIGRLAALPSWAGVAYAGLLLCVLALLAARFMFASPLPAEAGARAVMQARQGAILGAVLLVGISPHYPWYFAWLAPLACLAPFASVCWLLIAAPLLAHDPVDYLSLAALVYLPAAMLAVFDVRRARRRSNR